MRLEADVEIGFGERRVALRLRTDALVIGVAGPSGCGKSTLLRILAGVDRRAVGVVRFAGEVWQDAARFRAPWERRVGWVPQDPTLFPHRTVRDNLGWARPDPEVADWLELAPLLDRMPRHLSGGERQRVAIGRAWSSRPRLLLLDEPFSALDRPLRERIAPELARRAAASGATIVIVSHDEGDLRLLGAETWAVDGLGVRRDVEGGRASA